MNGSDLSLKWIILSLSITYQTGIYKSILTYLWRGFEAVLLNVLFLLLCCSCCPGLVFSSSYWKVWLILCPTSSFVQFAGWKMKPGHQRSGCPWFLIKTSYTDESCKLYWIHLSGNRCFQNVPFRLGIQIRSDTRAQLKYHVETIQLKILHAHFG